MDRKQLAAVVVLVAGLVAAGVLGKIAAAAMTPAMIITTNAKIPTTTISREGTLMKRSTLPPSTIAVRMIPIAPSSPTRVARSMKIHSVNVLCKSITAISPTIVVT